MSEVIRTENRPLDSTLRSTADLPATPQRDRRIESTSWIDAPRTLHELGADLDGQPATIYLRRIGERWLLWRAGPADGDSRYGAVDLYSQGSSDSRSSQDSPDSPDSPGFAMVWFRLFSDGSGLGTGPDGTEFTRFRTWKEALRDAS